MAEAFRAIEREEGEILQKIRESGRYKSHGKIVEQGRREGKYQLDLWLANLVILMRAGISQDRIAVTDLCTCHNPDYLFSHRASEGKRGNLAAFLMLKQTQEEKLND